MSFTATSVCFYCGNQINRNQQPHIHAAIEHRYKHGGSRISDRNFHPSCFERFRKIGRPYNPETDYEVLESEEVNACEPQTI